MRSHIVKLTANRVVDGRLARKGEIVQLPESDTYCATEVVSADELARREKATKDAVTRQNWQRYVEENPPVAVIVAPAQVETRTPVTFDGSQSYGALEIVRWNWEPDVDNGEELEGEIVEYDGYRRVDTYTLALNIWDESGRRGRAEQDIEVV